MTVPWSKISTATILDVGAEESNSRMLGAPDAIREALSHAMSHDPRVFVMGQGVDDPSGMFGATRGLHLEFGADRVFDTPLAEAAMTGVTIGAAIGGMRPVLMHNRPDFLYLTMDQLINHASKWHFMFGGAQSVPLVVWACIGRGWGSGAQHSQALHGLFMQFPGLKCVMPSTAADSKGLMLAAIEDPNPVLIIEHRHAFKYKSAVPPEAKRVRIGRGVIRRPGRDVTIASISHMAIESAIAAQSFAGRGIDCEVLDLRSLRPLDEELIVESVSRTGRLVVADLGWPRAGFAAEVAAIAAERAFDRLKAPVVRVTCPDTPTPSGNTLEDAFYPGRDQVERAVLQVMGAQMMEGQVMEGQVRGAPSR